MNSPSDRAAVGPDEPFEVSAAVVDDFGVTSVELYWRVDGQPQRLPLGDITAEPDRQVDVNLRLLASQFRAPAGSSVEWWLRAADNKFPIPQVVESEHRVLLIHTRSSESRQAAAGVSKPEHRQRAEARSGRDHIGQEHRSVRSEQLSQADSQQSQQDAGGTTAGGSVKRSTQRHAAGRQPSASQVQADSRQAGRSDLSAAAGSRTPRERGVSGQAGSSTSLTDRQREQLRQFAEQVRKDQQQWELIQQHLDRRQAQSGKQPSRRGQAEQSGDKVATAAAPAAQEEAVSGEKPSQRGGGRQGGKGPQNGPGSAKAAGSEVAARRGGSEQASQNGPGTGQGSHVQGQGSGSGIGKGAIVGQGGSGAGRDTSGTSQGSGQVSGATNDSQTTGGSSDAGSTAATSSASTAAGKSRTAGSTAGGGNGGLTNPSGQPQKRDTTGDEQTTFTESRTTSPALRSVGKAVIELARQLRNDQVDPSLLKQLGWSRPQLSAFVKKYQQKFGELLPLLGKTDLSNERVADTTRRVGSLRLQTGVGQQFAVTTRTLGGKADEIRDILDSEKAKINPEYQQLLQGYLEALSRRQPQPQQRQPR